MFALPAATTVVATTSIAPTTTNAPTTSMAPTTTTAPTTSALTCNLLMTSPTQQCPPLSLLAWISLNFTPSAQLPIRISQATKPGTAIARPSAASPAWEHALHSVPVPLQSLLGRLGAYFAWSGSRATSTLMPVLVASLVILVPRHATTLRWLGTKVTAFLTDRRGGTPCHCTFASCKAA